MNGTTKKRFPHWEPYFVFHKADDLPVFGPNGEHSWLLGRGNGVSGFIGGEYSVMRYDGMWWNEDGTEVSGPPDEYCYLPPYP